MKNYDILDNVSCRVFRDDSIYLWFLVASHLLIFFSAVCLLPDLPTHIYEHFRHIF